MKQIIVAIAVALMAAINVSAQSLAGRVYQNPNIMGEEMQGKLKTLSEKKGEAKTKAYEKFEKEKGHKPNAEEKAKLDKEVDDAIVKAETILKGMVTKVSVEFKTEKDAVMKMDVKIDEGALKAAGIGWLKRKAQKAALAVAPSSEKAKYVVKGNMVIFDEDDDKDTLRLSNDGKYLYGKLDKKTNFKLTRTK